MKKDEKHSPPLVVEIDLKFYTAVKYNKGLLKYISKHDEQEFVKFKRLFKQFINKLEVDNHSAFSDMSALMSMWGYSRKYCGMCGRPIIGKINRIQNRRIVCNTCFKSYKITETLHQQEASERNSEEVASKKLSDIEILQENNSSK